jgi:hypothetical protein
MSPARSLLPVAALALFAACATTSSIRDEPLSAGTSRAFAAQYQTVIDAAREAVVHAGLTVQASRAVNDSTWMIVGDKPSGFMSYGGFARVVVERTSPTTTTVRVHTRRRVATSVTAETDYSPVILSYIDYRIR